MILIDQVNHLGQRDPIAVSGPYWQRHWLPETPGVLVVAALDATSRWSVLSADSTENVRAAAELRFTAGDTQPGQGYWAGFGLVAESNADLRDTLARKLRPSDPDRVLRELRHVR